MDFNDVLADVADTHDLMFATNELLNSLETIASENKAKKIPDSVAAYELSRVVGSIVGLNAMAFNHLGELNSHLEAMEVEANRA
ncbi:hypothetical protein ACLOEZ_11570 [Levilactobacillus brevis]|uniref:hypothetical protein n=1 Tax=Levilactobacillus brevis TaxID=1580 RepID=UPI0030CD0FCD